MGAISDCKIVFSGHECARAFLPRNWHPIELQHFEVVDFLHNSGGRKPAFRLPENCCDLCDQLGNLAIRAIGPDLRYESTQALFFPCRRFLVLKIHHPKEDPKASNYFSNRCYSIYSHPGTSPSPLLEHTLIICLDSRLFMSLVSLETIPVQKARMGFPNVTRVRSTP